MTVGFVLNYTNYIWDYLSTGVIFKYQFLDVIFYDKIYHMNELLK